MTELTYPEVGATRDGALPAGYHHFEREVTIGRGDAAHAAAAAGLLTFEMHRLAGLRPQASTPRAAVGTDVTCRFGLGPVGLRVPTRVVWVVDEPDRAGFGYGTRPGHPERGEEAFLVERGDGGAVRFTVRAFSLPATWFAKLGGPVTQLLVAHVNRRYVAAMRRLATPSR
jgi:uncharacterized protein (UPF0548 family)